MVRTESDKDPIFRSQMNTVPAGPYSAGGYLFRKFARGAWLALSLSQIQRKMPGLRLASKLYDLDRFARRQGVLGDSPHADRGASRLTGRRTNN